jgi:hypothetical protein
MHLDLYIYICTCIYIHTCIYTHIYIHISTYKHINIQANDSAENHEDRGLKNGYKNSANFQLYSLKRKSFSADKRSLYGRYSPHKLASPDVVVMSMSSTYWRKRLTQNSLYSTNLSF